MLHLGRHRGHALRQGIAGDLLPTWAGAHGLTHLGRGRSHDGGVSRDGWQGNHSRPPGPPAAPAHDDEADDGGDHDQDENHGDANESGLVLVAHEVLGEFGVPLLFHCATVRAHLLLALVLLRPVCFCGKKEMKEKGEMSVSGQEG